MMFPVPTSIGVPKLMTCLQQILDLVQRFRDNEDVDLSIAKNTRISFDSPSTRLDSPQNFGVITSASSANEARANFVGPRRIQFFMRLEF